MIFPGSRGGKANEVIVKEKIENYNEDGKTIKKKTETTHYLWNKMDKSFTVMKK